MNRQMMFRGELLIRSQRYMIDAMENAFSAMRLPFFIPAVPGTIESAMTPLTSDVVSSETTPNEMVSQIIQVMR